MATDPFHFVFTAENNIKNGHTTLMEPLVARLTKCHRFLPIFCETAITVQVDLLNLHCPFRQEIYSRHTTQLLSNERYQW